MARQPRFIEDDEPRRSGYRTTRYETSAGRVAPKNKPEAEEDVVTKLIDAEIAEAEKPADGESFDDGSTKVFAIEKGDRNEKGDRFENGGDDDEPPRKGSGKKLAMMILAIILGFAIVGAGVFALVHFVLAPPAQQTSDEAAVTEPPAIPEDPTLMVTPTHAPTEAPTEAKADYSAMADSYMKNMSDREKICQLFIVTPETLTASLDDSDSVAVVTRAGETTEKSLKEYPVGGLIYFSANLESQEQTKEMISNSQKYASTPLFISVDEEGGDVARAGEKLGTKTFKPMFEYKDQGETVAHDNAEVIASNLRAIGFNMDNAPVADVLSNPDNTVIGNRAYSDDFAQAATLVKAAVQGFRDGGVICTLKHFPGHGNTEEDSHDGLAYVKASVEELKKNELQPFKAGIEAGADMVMVGHLVVDELDPGVPATLSSKVVPELLRKELGYNGIVITDSMSMGAITQDYETIVKGLFAADVDIILQPDNLDSYISAIESLLESGDITQKQIDAKVKKILTLKYSKGIMTPSADAETSTESPAPATESTEAPAPVTPDTLEETPTIAA